MAATTIRISRKRKELISQYATAAISLYGVISVNEFVEVFNHYEEAHTTAEEAFLALTRLARTDDVEYSVFRGIISGPDFQPDFDDYEDNVKEIRKAQRGKPRYLPSKEEFLKYVDLYYREPEKPYAELKAYILNHELSPRNERIGGVDGDLLELHAMIQFGVAIKDELDYFPSAGYRCKDINEATGLLNLMTNAHNHTRMYDNNGFTPEEMVDLLRGPRRKPSPKAPPML